MHFVAEPLFLSPVTNVDIAGRLTPQHNEISPQSCNLVPPVFDLIVLFLQLCSLMFTKCIANLIHNPVQSSAFAIIIPFPSSSPFCPTGTSHRQVLGKHSSGLVAIIDNCMHVSIHTPFTSYLHDQCTTITHHL